MMHLRITDEIRERCLREAAHDDRDGQGYES